MNYTAALRVIGQDLERQGVKSFDVRFEDDEYIVQCGYQAPPAQTPVTIHYTFKDLEELDAMGAAQRGKVSASKDFLNQVQILRTIGGYLDNINANLLRITNNQSSGEEGSFTVEYVGEDGERVVDDRSGSAIYDLCVALYKQRKRLTGAGG